MPQPKSKNYDSAWAALISEELVAGTRGRPEGEGWMTAAEFAADKPISLKHARDVLRGLVVEGKLEMKKGKLGPRWVAFYRPVA